MMPGRIARRDGTPNMTPFRSVIAANDTRGSNHA